MSSDAQWCYGRVRRSSWCALVLALHGLGACGGDDTARGSGIPSVPPPVSQPPYERLSETGLFEDIAAKKLNPWAQPFRPNHVLWTDGADKNRWFFLPQGTQIDTFDMDHWDFPVGTRLFKEFTRDGARLETRLIQRIADRGDPLADYWMGAFVWLDDESDALFVEEGAEDIRGTTHDVPEVMQCWSCHGGEPGHVLGLSALQSSGPDSILTLDELVEKDRLTDPPAPGETYAVPGDNRVAYALGYLHVNCGPCHNDHGTARTDTDIQLRLFVDEATPAATSIYRTNVGVALDNWLYPTLTQRVAAGDPDSSALLFRMEIRGDNAEMPPLGTEYVDLEGARTIRRWIKSL